MPMQWLLVPVLPAQLAAVAAELAMKATVAAAGFVWSAMVLPLELGAAPLFAVVVAGLLVGLHLVGLAPLDGVIGCLVAHLGLMAVVPALVAVVVAKLPKLPAAAAWLEGLAAALVASADKVEHLIHLMLAVAVLVLATCP